MIDWLIRGARIIDGAGKASIQGDIAISGGRIVELGRLEGLGAKRLIEAEGRVACPGFIDMHSHSDVLFLNGSSLAHKVCQGVTTELIGQDGMSVAPLTEESKGPLSEMIEPLSDRLKEEWRPWDMDHFLENLAKKRVPVNVATLTGHCNLRLAVMGYKMALPSREELDRMGELLAVSLKKGAMGISLGLVYPPSSYSDTEELISLGKVVKDHDAILVVHMRDEQDGIVESLQEMMAVGRESGCKIHLSHLKCMGKKNWGRMAQVLELVEQAHKEGLAFSFDQYPYAASSTSLSSLLPGWALEGGWKGLEQRVRQPETLKKILSEVGITIENRGGPAAITIASVKTSGNKRFTGKSLKTISEERKMGSEQTALELLVEEQLQVIAIYHSLSKEDVELAMIHFLQMVGSDGILGEFPHPRVYGTFPRVIHFFSRARGLFPLEEAIRKMTSAPADRLNLRGRGRITRGSYADILLFSPDRFRDTATFDDPKQLAAGLDWVFVNGVPVIENGRLQEGSQGSVIRREV